MTIELPSELGSALLAQAKAQGVALDRYIQELFERNLQALDERNLSCTPLKSGLGMWSKYNVTLSDEDIDANRADVFGKFGDFL